MVSFFIFIFIAKSSFSERRDKQKNFLSADSFPTWSQLPELSQSKARSLEPLPHTPCRSRVPWHWASSTAFPDRKQVIEWEVDNKDTNVSMWYPGACKSRISQLSHCVPPCCLDFCTLICRMRMTVLFLGFCEFKEADATESEQWNVTVMFRFQLRFVFCR